MTKGHGKALLNEPDHHRRRDLANRAVDGDWSVRKLEAEIMRGRESSRARPAPHPDHARSGSNSRSHRQQSAGHRSKGAPSPARIPAPVGPSRGRPAHPAAPDRS
ncbi:MAG: hypothetical protein ACXVHQ_41845 [Solirubrobacteraceae bacterium]